MNEFIVADFPNLLKENHAVGSIHDWTCVIQNQGFKSCKFVRDTDMSGHWEMDDLDFTLFVLKYK